MEERKLTEREFMRIKAFAALKLSLGTSAKRLGMSRNTLIAAIDRHGYREWRLENFPNLKPRKPASKSRTSKASPVKKTQPEPDGRLTIPDNTKTRWLTMSWRSSNEPVQQR